MKNLKYVPALALVAALQLVTVGAFAQPDPNNAPKLENPQNRNPMLGRNRAQIQQGQPLIQQLDPAAIAQMQQQRAKMQLQRAGITDVAQQDAILAYTQGEQEAEAKLREKGQELQRSMRANTLTDAQLVALINSYHVAIEDNKERRTKAINTLKAAIDFTKYPRVEAYLLLSGLYGDGPTLAGGGMRGGQFGIMQNGRGGQFGAFGGGQGQQNGNANTNRLNRNNAQANAAGAANQDDANAVMPDGTNTKRNRNRNRLRNNTPEAPAAPLPEA